ncbi:MAG: PIN domain-containing protein [Bacillota bacterium]
MDQGRSKVFIDSGGFIALVYKDDHEHKKAVQYYASIKDVALFYTTNLVVAETYTWLRYHTSHSAAVKFLDVVERAAASSELVVVQADITIEEKARRILRKYTDQTFSYTDATSFVVLDLLNINEVLGFDAHFFMFGRNLNP